MNVTGYRALALVCAAILLATPAGQAVADNDAARRRVEELERQQQQFNRELQQLRRQLDIPPDGSQPTAAPAPTQEGERVEEVERRQSILASEVDRLRELLVLPETGELKQYYGLAPAASRVYGIKRGLSIGGYGETNFKLVVKDGDGEKNEFDFVRFVMYVGYKYNDWIVLNSEIEFEHATTSSTVSSGGGSVSLEFATLDFLLHEHANARGGLILMPVGFVNLVHEPPFYFGNTRPPVEIAIIPTTWREPGFGLYGNILPDLDYQMYGVVSFNAKGYRNTGLRNARQQGNRDLADDWAFVGRLDYDPIPSTVVGGSMFLGNAGQDQDFGNDTIGFEGIGAFTQLYEVHAQFQSHGVHLRALGTAVHIDDALRLSQDAQISKATGGEPIAKDMLGAYIELAYDVMPLILPDTTHYLAPWFRYSWLDTQNNVPSGYSPDLRQRQDFYEFGLQYKPIPEVVLKADYHIQDRASGTAPDVLRLGGGFIF
ncbi:hypothetical protein L6Q96_00770 [Candidatus Binatia bacterium]|nr:hypothetical protein [Candidatus Binatia bacterium]